MRLRAWFPVLICGGSFGAPVGAQVTVAAVTIDEAFAETRHFHVPLRRQTVASITLTRGFHLSVPQGSTQTNLSFALTELPGRSWAASLSADAAYPLFGSRTGANGRTHADVLVSLRSPTPVGGVLSIKGVSLPTNGLGLGQAIAWVDVHNDGSRDFFLDPTAPYNQLQWTELPLTVDSAGTVVRLTHWGNISTAPGTFDDYAMDLEVRFVAGVSPASPYGAAQSYPLTIDRQPDGSMSVSFRQTGGPGLLLLLGSEQQSQVLPFPPGDLLLTTVDLVLPMATPVIRLPAVLLPGGAGFNAQGIDLAVPGEVRTSGAVRIGS